MSSRVTATLLADVSGAVAARCIRTANVVVYECAKYLVSIPFHHERRYPSKTYSSNRHHRDLAALVSAKPQDQNPHVNNSLYRQTDPASSSAICPNRRPTYCSESEISKMTKLQFPKKKVARHKKISRCATAKYRQRKKD